MFDINGYLKQRGLSIPEWNSLCALFDRVDSVNYPYQIFEVFDYAKQRGMNVGAGHVHAETYTKNNVAKLKIMPTIAGYRHVAFKSGEFAGLDEPEFGPDIQIPLNNGEVLIGPKWCKIKAYRLVQGQKVSVTSVEFLTENIVYGYSGMPTPIWRKRPHGQLNVRTEAQALRKLFDNCDKYTPEEMELENSIEFSGNSGLVEKNDSDDIVLSETGKSPVQVFLQGYAESQTVDEMNAVSRMAEQTSLNLSKDEWENVITAYNEANARLRNQKAIS